MTLFRSFPKVPGGSALWSDPSPAGNLLRAEFFGATPPGLTGTLEATLDALTIEAAGTVGSGGITGELTATLGEVTVVAAGAVTISGALTATLDALTSSGAGTVAVAGTLNATLGALTLNGAGTVAIAGAATIPLGDLTLGATGAVAVTGALTATLDAMTTEATGTVESGEPPPAPPVQTRPMFAIIGKPEDGKSLRKLRLEQQKAEDAILEKAMVALALELV